MSGSFVMGDNPFRECVDRVMRDYDGNMARPTLDVMSRRYKVLEKSVLNLYCKGKISTMAPAELTAKDLESIYWHLKARKGQNGEVTTSSMKKDMTNLNRLCLYEGNGCYQEFRMRFPSCRLTEYHERLSVFTEAEINRIFNVEPSTITEGHLIRSYGMLAMYFGAGVRTVELRNIKVANIRTTPRGVFVHLDVVKGIGTYGKPRDALILPQMVPMMNRYLQWRAEQIRRSGIHNPYYVFAYGKSGMASDNLVRQIRQYAAKDLHIEYDGRKCRRTYGQFLKDRGTSIEAVSVLLGHNKTKTTEDYYARMSPSMALDDAIGALGGNGLVPSVPVAGL